MSELEEFRESITAVRLDIRELITEVRTLKDLHKRVDEMDKSIVIFGASSKSAHKRIDELEAHYDGEFKAVNLRVTTESKEIYLKIETDSKEIQTGKRWLVGTLIGCGALIATTLGIILRWLGK